MDLCLLRNGITTVVQSEPEPLRYEADTVSIALMYDLTLCLFTGNVEAWFIVDIMTSRGYTREEGSILVTVLGFANFLGRVSGSTLRFKCK